MAGSLNKVLLVGHLGLTPELRYTNNNNIPVTTLRLCTNKKREGEQIATWHNVTVWGQQGQLCCQYLRKGSLVLVEAELQYKLASQDSDWLIPEIVANRVEFL